MIECLKENGIVDLDSKIATHTVPDWVATKAMVSSWLADAVMYELWVDSDGSVAKQVYFSDLSWPIAKILHWKQIRDVKQALRITNTNLEERESEVLIFILQSETFKKKNHINSICATKI